MTDDNPDDSQDAEVATLASEFYAVEDRPEIDRGTAIGILDKISRLFSWRSLQVWVRGEPYLALYGGMEVYGLLENGWGHNLYSGEPDPDRLDELLFASLLAVMQATDRVMPRGADLNKRAYEACEVHALNPTGRRLVDNHIRQLKHADEQADRLSDRDVPMSGAESVEESSDEAVEVPGVPTTLREKFSFTTPPAHETRRWMTGEFRVDGDGTVRLSGLGIDPYGLDLDELGNVNWSLFFRSAIMCESREHFSAEHPGPSLDDLMNGLDG